MATVSRRVITERYGDPASFAFYGQYYHSTTPAKCALCGRDSIRNVYTMRSPHGRSVPTGECCFTVFKINAGVYTRLLAAKVLLNASDEGIASDVKIYNAMGDLSHRLREWRRLKRQVMTRVREHRKTTGSDWLPKELHDLKVEAEKKPGKSLRWFDSHIPLLTSNPLTERDKHEAGTKNKPV